MLRGQRRKGKNKWEKNETKRKKSLLVICGDGDAWTQKRSQFPTERFLSAFWYSDETDGEGKINQERMKRGQKIAARKKWKRWGGEKEKSSISDGEILKRLWYSEDTDGGWKINKKRMIKIDKSLLVRCESRDAEKDLNFWQGIISVFQRTRRGKINKKTINKRKFLL